LGEFESTVARPLEPAHGLHPAEDLLYPLAQSLADGIARVASGSSVDGAAASARVLRYVGCDPPRAYVVHAVLGVIALVRPQRLGFKPFLSADSA